MHERQCRWLPGGRHFRLSEPWTNLKAIGYLLTDVSNHRVLERSKWTINAASTGLTVPFEHTLQCFAVSDVDRLRTIHDVGRFKISDNSVTVFGHAKSARLHPSAMAWSRAPDGNNAMLHRGCRFARIVVSSSTRTTSASLRRRIFSDRKYRCQD
jgi:hypothetical protein